MTEDNAEIHVGLGDGLRDARRLEEALEHYRQAAALDPADSTIANNLAGTLYELGRLDEAAAAYRVALAKRPEQRDGPGQFSTVLTRLGQPGEAEIHLRRAIELEPTASIPAHLSGLLLYLKAGRPDLVSRGRAGGDP